jgi:tetratricopeptide (TPR) repeat protein
MAENADKLADKLLAMGKLTGDPQAMLKKVDEEHDKYSEDHMFHVLRGFALAKLKRYDESLDSLKKALELNPRSAWANYRMGEVYYELEDYETAITYFEKACQLKPANSAFWLQKALSEFESNKIKDAYKSFEKAIHRGDKTGWGWLGKSKVLVILNMLDDALEAARMAKKVNPSDEVFKMQEDYILRRMQGD